MKINCQLNGRERELDIQPGETLLDALRAAGQFSVKRGCETGDCGACTVLLDGQPVNSCVVAAARATEREVLTLEGLLQDDVIQKLQAAMVAAGAVQCGYCSPGLLLSLYALLQENPQADEAAIRHCLTGNLCRCTGYVKPVEAALAVARGQEVQP
jgi:putative selenate reductase molybdopterin-binding subunit